MQIFNYKLKTLPTVVGVKSLGCDHCELQPILCIYVLQRVIAIDCIHHGSVSNLRHIYYSDPLSEQKKLPSIICFIRYLSLLQCLI